MKILDSLEAPSLVRNFETYNHATFLNALKDLNNSTAGFTICGAYSLSVTNEWN